MHMSMDAFTLPSLPHPGMSHALLLLRNPEDVVQDSRMRNLSGDLLAVAVANQSWSWPEVNGSVDWSVFDDVLKHYKEGLYTYNQPKNIVLISIYVPVFLMALLGNMLVILVIVANRSMRSVTNYFLLNLAVADLLVTLVCIPLTVGEMVYKAWIYGLFLCRATGYLQGVSIAASVLTIMGLSLDRYLVLSHPVKARRISTPEHARKVLFLIWVIAGSIMVPLAFIRQLAIHPLDPNESLAFCHERWPGPHDRRIYDVFLFVFIYFFPGVVVVVSYSATGCHLVMDNHDLHRQNSDIYQNYRIIAGRRRVARMLLGLACLFAFSWLPYHIVSLYFDFSNKSSRDPRSLAALSFALLLGHSHSAQNPILYCIMNSSFKRGMLSLIKCRRPAANELSRSDTRCLPETSFHMRLANSFRCSRRRRRHSDISRSPKGGTLTVSEARTRSLLQNQSTSEGEAVVLSNRRVANGRVKGYGEQNNEASEPMIKLTAIYEENGRCATVIQNINNMNDSDGEAGSPV